MEKAALISRAREYAELEKDPVFAQEVKDLLAQNDDKELEDRFYRDLEDRKSVV